MPESKVKPELHILSLEEIIAAQDLPERDVLVPEWGGKVRIRAFSKGKQQEMRKQAQGPDGKLDTEKLELLMFIHGVTEPAFTVEHYNVLKDKSSAAIDRINGEIAELSGMTEEAEKEAEKTFPSES